MWSWPQCSGAFKSQYVMSNGICGGCGLGHSAVVHLKFICDGKRQVQWDWWTQPPPCVILRYSRTKTTQTSSVDVVESRSLTSNCLCHSVMMLLLCVACLDHLFYWYQDCSCQSEVAPFGFCHVATLGNPRILEISQPLGITPRVARTPSLLVPRLQVPI